VRRIASYGWRYGGEFFLVLPGIAVDFHNRSITGTALEDKQKGMYAPVLSTKCGRDCVIQFS
jgi:hypothetical protein